MNKDRKRIYVIRVQVGPTGRVTYFYFPTTISDALSKMAVTPLEHFAIFSLESDAKSYTKMLNLNPDR